MIYQMKPLSCDPARLTGLSEKLIVSHYENNYGGAVKRLNAITSQLAELDMTKAPVFVLNGLKREELIAANVDLLAARWPAPQSMGVRSCACAGRRHTDSRARHVRALVPHRLRREGSGYVDAFMANIRWSAVAQRWRMISA